MTRQIWCVRYFGLVVCAAFLVVGCGGGKPKGVKVEGNIVKGGSPFSAPSGGHINLSFQESDTKAYPAKVSNDGSFVAENVPPGKYKVKLGVAPEANDKDSLAKVSALSKQLATASSKLDYDVTNDETQKITVDLDKGTVTKK